MGLARLFLYFAALLAVAFPSHAAAVNVGVYIEPHDGDPQGYCLETSEGADAFQVLQELEDAEFKVINGQHILCSVDDSTHFVCNPESDRSLRVILQEGGKWLDDSIPSFDAGSKCYDGSFNALLNFVHYSFTTHTFSNTHYCAKQGDVLGIIDEERPAHRPEAPRFSMTPAFSELCEPVQINKVKAYVDGAVQDVDEIDGRVKDVYPGSELKLELGIKHIGPRKIEREIKDVTVAAAIEDIDNGRDLRQTSQEFSLDSRDNGEVVFAFAIPQNAKERSYDLTIRLEGEDENGFSFEKETAYKVNVEREKSKLFIEDLSASTSSLCPGESAAITARLRNIGSSKSAGILSLRNDEIGAAYSQQVELEGATNAQPSVKDVLVPVKMPAKALAKTYLIIATFAESSQSVNLTVNGCQGAAQLAQASKSAMPSPTAYQAQIQGSAISPPESVSKDFTKNLPILFFFLLLVLFVVYILMLLMLLAKKG